MKVDNGESFIIDETVSELEVARMSGAVSWIIWVFMNKKVSMREDWDSIFNKESNAVGVVYGGLEKRSVIGKKSMDLRENIEMNLAVV